MSSFYIFLFLGISVAYFFYRIVLPPVESRNAKKVIFGNNESFIPIYAHRGGCHQAPENTIAAIREAKKNGAWGVEIDVAFTKDNVPVLFHDDRLERTTNGKGWLKDIDLEQLKNLDASFHFPLKNNTEIEKVPTLEEAIVEALQLDLRIIFDLKDYDSRSVTAMMDMFAKYPALYDYAIAASFFPNIIYQLRQSDPKIVTALTWRPLFVGYESIPDGRPRFQSWPARALAYLGDILLEWSFHNFLWYVTGVSGVLVHKDVLSQEYVRQWRSRGIHVFAWTPNHPLEKEYLTKVLRVSIITDTLL